MASPAVTRLNALLFHEIQEAPRAHTAVSTSLFEYCLNSLATVGLHVCSIGQALSQSRDAQRIASVTFDDGNASDFEVAFPLLVARSMPATFFLISGRVGQPRCVTWPQAREMAAAGMEIGSHTTTHPHLPSLTQAALRSELRNSKRAIEDEIGREVVSVAFPGGFYNHVVVQEAFAAGYRAVCTSDPGLTNLPLRRRQLVHRNSVHQMLDSEGISARISATWFDTVRWRSGAAARRLVQRAITPEKYLRLRDAITSHIKRS